MTPATVRRAPAAEPVGTARRTQLPSYAVAYWFAAAIFAGGTLLVGALYRSGKANAPAGDVLGLGAALPADEANVH